MDTKMGHDISRPRDIEMQSLDQDMSKFTNLPLHNDIVAHGSTTDPLGIGAEVFRAKVGQHRRSWRTILILSILLSLFLVATAVLGVLYGVRASEGPRVTTTTTTATQSMTEVLTSWDTLTLIVTSLQPTTQTMTETATMIVTDVTTTTRRRKTTSVTVLVTTSLSLTATATGTTTTASVTATTTDTLEVTTTSIATVSSITTSLVGSSHGGNDGSRRVTTETRFTTVTAGDGLSSDRRRP